MGPLAGYIALSRTKTSFSLERKMVGPSAGRRCAGFKSCSSFARTCAHLKARTFPFSRAVVRRVDGHLCRRLPLWLLGGFVEK